MALEHALEGYKTAPKEDGRVLALEAAAAAARETALRMAETEEHQAHRLRDLELRSAEQRAELSEQRKELERLRAPPEVRSDYVAVADEELDQKLEKEIMDMGVGVLKGGKLERIGPKSLGSAPEAVLSLPLDAFRGANKAREARLALRKYKMGDKKIFMQLSDGKVTVRSGGGSSKGLESLTSPWKSAQTWT